MTREMFRLCDHGLFVGVDYYRKLRKEKWLTSSRDAGALLKYFHDTHKFRGEQWRVLTSRRGKPPKRLHVMKELRKFVKRIHAGGAGIFYFSGHAKLGARGLLLKCYDTEDGLLEDSALSFAHVLDVLGAQEADSKHFLVILDCCREGDASRPADTLPGNVCVLYACAHGGEAVQDSRGGLLTQSLLGHLNGASSFGHLSARALRSRARQWAFRHKPVTVREFELVGCRTNELNVPLQRSTRTLVGPAAGGPVALLRYSPENQTDYDSIYCGLKAATLEWYGFPRSDFRDRGIFERYFWSRERDTFVCEVRMPDDGIYWSASEFVLHLADAAVDMPAILLFRWPGRIEMESIIWIRNIVTGEWHPGAGDTQTLVWRETIGRSEYRGSASLTVGNRASEVAVRCNARELDALPLSCLRSTLHDIYEAFRAVQCTGG